MASDNKIQMPGVFGGLVRYDDEYKSRFMISPVQVIIFLVLVALFVFALRIFWPTA
ncbi:preprotein translocase subunit Sec61beta [Candidatus Pacearchaeota archaeon]|nr:preprotein translocase subunit Sec61beta [Candidatus Pacearchaeota archaeon]